MKFLATPLGIVTATVGAVAVSGIAFAITSSTSSAHPDAKVLGEKIVGSGSSTISPSSGSSTPAASTGSAATGTSNTTGTATGTTSSSSGDTSVGANVGNATKPNGNGNGNGGKTFTISGTVSGLYPGGQVFLRLYITNPNQDMNVTALTATPTTIVLAKGVSGTCTPGLTVGNWTGSKFLVLKNAVNQQAPGHIAISMSKDAGDACQGATFNFSYSGTGAQA